MPRTDRATGRAQPFRVLIAIATVDAIQRQMIEGVLRFVRTTGARWQFDYRDGVESSHLTFWQPGQWDGILGFPYGMPRGVLRQRPKRIPIILIEDYQHRHIPVVRADNRAVAQMAFEHFLSKGLRRFSYVGYESIAVFRERGRGFAKAVRDAGLELFNPRQADYDQPRPHRDVAIAKWLQRLAKPIGIFAGNSYHGRWLLELCRWQRLMVPEEVAVLAVDNQAIECELCWPPLSTIDHGMEPAGFEAASLLHRLMAGQPAPTKPIVVQPVGVIERHSTDVLLGRDPDVRAAVALIRQRATMGLSVKELMESLPVARRKLEIAFREHVGRSIHDELTRMRLERAKLLLKTTDLPMPDVAAASGFDYASHFSALFKKQLGATPTAYRRQHRATRVSS